MPSVKPKSTWAILKPHVNSLVSSVVFPTLTFDNERAELWQSDPVEFTRRTLGMLCYRCGACALIR